MPSASTRVSEALTDSSTRAPKHEHYIAALKAIHYASQKENADIFPPQDPTRRVFAPGGSSSAIIDVEQELTSRLQVNDLRELTTAATANAPLAMGNETAPSGPPVGANPVGLWEHTEGRSTTLFYTAIFLPVFCVPIVILRLWTSKRIVGRWHKDDTLTVIATIFGIFQSAIVCVEARLGAGDHIVNITLEGLDLVLKVSKWGGVPVYNLTTLFIKASILVFYLRFTVDTALRICTFIVLLVVVAYSLTNAIAAIVLDCNEELKDNCRHLLNIFIAGAALNVATDVAILLLPFWILRPMKVSMGRKVGIAFVLMAGGFVSAVSIIRLVATTQANKEVDVTYGWGDSVKWRYFLPCSTLNPGSRLLTRR
ncbi:hypothetical protein ACJZ2D_004105 [Fusarium nematophilum]